MSLAERVESIAPYRQQCKPCIWYDGLPKQEREAFDTLTTRVNPDDLSKSQLHRWCVEEGLQCGESSFKRHLGHHEPH